MAQSRKRRVALACALLAIVIAVYSYPSLKARTELGSSDLPPIFAPDLSLYLNLSNLTPVNESQVENPYYHISVPKNGAGYLKFGLAARLFGSLDRILDGRTWFALFIWNAFWWGCLCITAICIFERFLPSRSQTIVVLGVALLMLFNFGILKTVILAWAHLPSIAAFNNVGLPFMRAFIPVIPCVLVLAYLGLQMEALQKRRNVVWVAMALLQLVALAVFPYATVMMAGLTAASILAQPIRVRVAKTWRIPLLYALVCLFLDCAFLLHSSVGFYGNRSPAIHFQPQLLPHLIGWNWVLIVALTVAVAFNKTLTSEVKWPLVGLGATNALLMLGDTVVPATTILLSHHAGHFVHATIATLITFLAATTFTYRRDNKSWATNGFVVLLSLLILVNGVLMVSGTYRSFLDINREVVGLSHLRRAWIPNKGDIVLAPSKDVDDACGWMVLMSSSPVLFCTDAEVMLTPQQNRDVHRFRQALYLYFTGEDSNSLQHELSGSDPSSLMYRLGYWAEAVSHSTGERRQGVLEIQTDLIPLLHRVEDHDLAMTTFLGNFRRIIVIDKQQDHTFASDRLTSFLEPKGNQSNKDFVVSFYSPRAAKPYLLPR